MQGAEHLSDAVAGEAIPDLGCDIGQRLLLAGLDLGDAHDGDRELALDGLGKLVLLQAEGDVGDLGIDHLGARQHPQVDLLGREAELGCRFLEVLGLRQFRIGLLGGGHVGERHLRDATLLGNAIAVLGSFVGGLQLLVGDRDALHAFVAAQQQHVGLARFQGDVLALVLLVEGTELGVVGVSQLDELFEVRD